MIPSDKDLFIKGALAIRKKWVSPADLTDATMMLGRFVAALNLIAAHLLYTKLFMADNQKDQFSIQFGSPSAAALTQSPVQWDGGGGNHV